MQTEIERKFLVKFLPSNIEGVKYIQGYLQSDKKRTVRIRTVKDTKTNTGFLTIKGLSNKNGISRYEFETEILTPGSISQVIDLTGDSDADEVIDLTGDEPFSSAAGGGLYDILDSNK